MECQSCPFAPIVKSVQNLLALNEVIEKTRNSLNLNRVKADVKKSVSSLLDAYSSIPRETITSLQNAAIDICLNCSHLSDDDNPSNHGQNFVSLDAEVIGKDSSSNYREEVLSHHMAPDYHRPKTPSCGEANPQNTTPRGCTSLPPEIEDTLRRELATFLSFPDITDQILIIARLCGMSLTTFASLSWMPRSLRQITKQAAQVRWSKIIRRWPTAKAIADAKIGRSHRNGSPINSPWSHSDPNGKPVVQTDMFIESEA